MHPISRLVSFTAAVGPALALVFVAPVAAQDLPTDQLSQHADVVRQGVLRDKTVFRNRPNIGRGRSYNRNKFGHNRPSAVPSRNQQAARARATCAYKGRAAARHGRADPRVRQLYALCAQAGY